MAKYKATGIIACYSCSLGDKKYSICISSDHKYENKNLWADCSPVSNRLLALPCDLQIPFDERFFDILSIIASTKSKATFYMEYAESTQVAKLSAVELTNEK